MSGEPRVLQRIVHLDECNSSTPPLSRGRHPEKCPLAWAMWNSISDARVCSAMTALHNAPEAAATMGAVEATRRLADQMTELTALLEDMAARLHRIANTLESGAVGTRVGRAAADGGAH